MDAANLRTTRQRRAAGVFFTPPAVVRYLVRHTLEPLLDTHQGDRPLRILEPACGDGGILAEAFRCLRQQRLQECVQQAAAQGSLDQAHLLRDAEGNWQLGDSEQRRLLLSSCFGLDIDPEFVSATRRELAGLVAAGKPAQMRSMERVLRTNIRCGDALLGPDFELPPDADGGDQPVDWKRDFADIWQASGGGFDAVIGNPPYVNIRRLTLSRSAAVKQYLRTHYQCARGAYDLYVLFLELAFRVLRPGGLCGLIVPNKLAGLNYAGPCRALLSEQTTIRRIVDLSQWRVFPDAGVYPYIVIWQKQPPAAEHRIAVVQAASEAELAADRGEWYVRQSALSAAAGWHLHGTLDVESRVTTRPLRTLARLHSGTTGFQAAALARELTGEPTGAVSTRRGEYFRFVVSGNIDRYRICWGRARFMKRTLDPAGPGSRVAGADRRQAAAVLRTQNCHRRDDAADRGRLGSGRFGPGSPSFCRGGPSGRSPVPVGAAELEIAFVPVSRPLSSQAVVGGLFGDQQESTRPASHSHRASGRPGGGADSAASRALRPATGAADKRSGRHGGADRKGAGPASSHWSGKSTNASIGCTD